MGWVVNATIRPLYPGKQSRNLLNRRVGRPKGRSKRVRKISPAPGFDPRTVQPVASRYNDYAIPVHIYNCIPETNHVSEVALQVSVVTIYGTCNVTSHVECFVLVH